MKIRADEMTAVIKEQLKNYGDVNSTTFEVHITAKAGDSTREYTAILYRTGADIQVVSFWWK